MKFLTILLVHLLGLTTCFPTEPSKFSQLKHILYENEVIDPDAYYAVDHLVRRIADPNRRNETFTNMTDTTDMSPGNDTRIGNLPSPRVNCYGDRPLDFVQTMLAVVQLANLCSMKNIPSNFKWSSLDPTDVSRVFVCNWGGTNRCELGEIIEAIALITEKCKGTYAGVVYIDGWKKAYGLDYPDTKFCPSI
ncbi:hypothetical protein F5Y18DRAFT_426392 [Xylariaceae sp. FL1019]|nr:hypothetical protein F5Y18DRAFT_426392 [Xylariaceae sp. FL1019]